MNILILTRIHNAPCLVHVEHSVGSYTNNALTARPLVHLLCLCFWHIPKERGCATASGVMARMGALGCLHDITHILTRI